MIFSQKAIAKLWNFTKRGVDSQILLPVDTPLVQFFRRNSKRRILIENTLEKKLGTPRTLESGIKVRNWIF